MSDLIRVGSRLVDLHEPQSIKLFQSLNWLAKYEPDTPENIQVMTALKKELRNRAFSIKDYKDITKMFELCGSGQYPYQHTAHCCLKKGHDGKHFSNDRLPKLIYW